MISMNPKLASLVTRLAAVVLIASCVGCAQSSDAYIAEAEGYAVVRGKIVLIEDLTTQSLEHLSDGLALTVSESGCTVTMQFDSGNRSFPLEVGAKVVHGEDADYLLQPQVKP